MHNKDTLRVITHPTPEGIYEVHWQWCSKKQGIIKVDMQKAILQASVKGMETEIAELHGIHYIMENLRFGGDSCGGINLTIYCSMGGTKKAIKRKGKYTNLYPWALFMLSRFSACEVVVEKDESFKHPKALQNISNIEYKGTLCNRIKDFRGEWFEVTGHAIERIAQRWNIGQETEEAWRKLMLVFGDEVTLEYVEVAPDGRKERYFFNELQNVLFACKDEAIVSVIYTERKDIKWLKKMTAEAVI